MTITAEDVRDAIDACLHIRDDDEENKFIADFLNARLASRATARTDDVERVAIRNAFYAGFAAARGGDANLAWEGSDTRITFDRAALGDPK